jgi:hypothetical protein
MNFLVFEKRIHGETFSLSNFSKLILSDFLSVFNKAGFSCSSVAKNFGQHHLVAL